MGEISNNPPDSLLSYRTRVEEIIGVPLLPQDVPYEIIPDTERPDIRVRVHDAVMQVAREVVGKAALKPEVQFTDSQREKLIGYAGELIVQGRRQIIIANNVAESLSRPAFVPPGADPPDTPRALLQTTMGRALYDFMQRPHRTKIPGAEEGLLGPLRSGLLVVSATATGKTVPPAELAQRAGVGKPYAETDPAINKILIVVPSVRLVKAYMDPDETFKRWLPGIEFTDFWHGAHNVGGACQIVLDESLEAGIESGAIILEDYPIRMVDEGHRAGEPRKRRLLTSLATGRLILCTATPREMGRYFSDFTASRARSAAEQGITRPVRLFTYLHGPKPGDAEQTTARIAAQVIRAGRKVGIYCRTVQGQAEAAQQARAITALVNKQLNLSDEEGGGEGREYVKVIATVSGAEANEDAEEEFREGDLMGYTAIGMLGEGVNIPMDALIIVGGRPLRSQWLVDQLGGRLPRPIFGRSDAKRPGWLIEVNPREVRQDNPVASIWRTYDYEIGDTIEQGRLFGEAPSLPEDDEEPVRRETGQPSAGRRGFPDSDRAADWDKDEALAALADVQGFLAPPVPLREITVAPEDWALYEPLPEGSKPLSELASTFGVPIVWLRRQLDKLSQREDLTIRLDTDSPDEEAYQFVPIQIGYVGVRDTNAVDTEKRWEFERWYNEETVKYLEQNPPARLAEAEVMDITGIAEMCAVDRKYVEHIIGTFTTEELPPVERLGRSHRPTKHFKLAEVGKIIARIEATPIADPETEEAISDLAQELDEGFVYGFVKKPQNGITIHDRRRHPSSGITGFARHISKEDAEHIRYAFYNPPVPGDDEISLVEVARRAGIDLGSVSRYIDLLPEDEQPDIVMRKMGIKGRMAEHVKKDAGRQLIEKLRPRKLLPNQVTLGMLVAYFGSEKSVIKTRIDIMVKKGFLSEKEAKPEIINLSGRGSRSSVWSWHIMQVLDEHGYFDRPSGIEPVDYSLVASGPYDIRWEYSEQVQSQLADPAKLAKLPGRDKMRRLPDRIMLPLGAMPLDDYVSSRQVDKTHLLEVIAHGEAGDITLYYDDDDDPGSPFFVIDGFDVGKLDRLYEYQPPETSDSVPVPAKPAPDQSKTSGTPPVAEVVRVELPQPPHAEEVTASMPEAPATGHSGLSPAAVLFAPPALPPDSTVVPADDKAIRHPSPDAQPAEHSESPTPTATQDVSPTEDDTKDNTKDWIDADTVRESTGCDPYAFQFLMQLAKVRGEDIMQDNSGMVIGFSPAGATAMRNYRIGPARSGWTRLAMIARHGGNSPIDLAYEALMRYQEERGRPFTEREVVVGRNGTTVELYADQSIARPVQRMLRQEADQTILSGRKRTTDLGGSLTPPAAS